MPPWKAWLRPAAVGYLVGVLSTGSAGMWVQDLATFAFGPDTKFFWYFSRAAGITAYLLLSAAMILGVGVMTRLFDRLTIRANSFALHEHLSWLALGFTGLHAGALLFDRYQPFSLADVLVPFVALYRPVPVALGILGLYTVALLIASFYLKPRLSHRAWRAVHYTSFGTYLLATAHGLLAGSGTGQAWMHWLYLASGATVLFLTLYRILLPFRTAVEAPGRPRRAAPTKEPLRPT